MQPPEILLVGGSGGLGQATAKLLHAQGACKTGTDVDFRALCENSGSVPLLPNAPTPALAASPAYRIFEGTKLKLTYKSNAQRAQELQGIAEIQQADITVSSDRKSLLDASPNLYGLVIFTGMPARTAESWEDSLATNYTGPILLAREAADRMPPGGSIVIIATMQAQALFPNSTIYAGAKAALVHAAKILAKERRGTNEIRVNIISPGVMNAGMAATSIQSGKYDKFLTENQIPRWGKAEDIARAVSFFLTPDNYITGQHLLVDGGLTL